MAHSYESSSIISFFYRLSRHPAFDYWLPDAYFPQESLDRIRGGMVVLLAYVVNLLNVPLVSYYVFVRWSPLDLVACAIGFTTFLSIPALLKWTGALSKVAHVLCLISWLATALAAYGGSHTLRTGLPWLMLPLLYAALLASRRAALLWSMVSIATMVGFYFVGPIEPLTSADILKIKREHTFSTVLLTCLVAGLLLFQETLNELLVGRLERARSDLQKLAVYDDLTGLPNRTLFRDRLEQSVHRARRRSETVVVGFFDLDNFKHINDLYGHSTGDRLLSEVASRIEETIRDEDTLARLGGDEFVGVFESVEDRTDVDAIARRIRQCLETDIHMDEIDIQVDISMGFSQLTPDDLPDITDAEIGEILRKAADQAMYSAKSDTGTDWTLSRVDPNLQHEQQIERIREIERGAEKGEFVPYYQPIVRLDDRTWVGAEILARWEHPDMGIQTPDTFLSLAEESGLLDNIQRSVFHNIHSDVHMLEEVMADGSEPIALFVNLEPTQLHPAEKLDDIDELLRDASGRSVAYAAEITETDLLGDNPIDRQLRRYGCRVIVDDFGARYSSLNRLTELSIDGLKIDMSFVQHIDEDISRAIVENIADLGSRLDIPVIGKGIETTEQLRALESVRGCRYAQGYYLAEPESVEAFAERLEDAPGLETSIFSEDEESG